MFIFFIFNFLIYFCFYFIFFFVFVVFLIYLFKIIFLLFFFFLNIVAFLFLFDINNFWSLYLDFYSIFEYVKYFTFLKGAFIFLYDFCQFFFYFILNFFNLKNFVGIFFQIYYFLNYCIYEVFFMMFDQVAEKTSSHKYNWMPKYVLGDSLEYSLKLNKILGLFTLNDVFQEKIFVYRRVGILHSRFWLFRSFVYQPYPKNAEEKFRRRVGDFIEPGRWLLDLRDFNISDYLDPWHAFLNKEVFGYNRFPLLKKKKSEYISVQLMHNYYAIMESGEQYKTQRVYFNYMVTTYAWYEYIGVFLLLTYLFNLIDEHLQLDLLFLEQEDEGEPDQGYHDFTRHPYYVGMVDDNLESKFFENYVLDVEDYITDDDLSWDYILAQPKTPRMHDTSDLDDFELKREMNMLLNEFRSFSIFYPIYRLLNKLSLYNFSDFFSFNNSGKCFSILFSLFLYLPIALFISVIKILVKLFDWFRFLNLFFQILLCFVVFLLLFLFF